MDDSPQSKGGKARAASLSSFQRKEIASLAAKMRWHFKKDQTLENSIRINFKIGNKSKGYVSKNGILKNTSDYKSFIIQLDEILECFFEGNQNG